MRQIIVILIIVSVLLSIFYNIGNELKDVLVQFDITILRFTITLFSIIIGFMIENETKK